MYIASGACGFHVRLGCWSLSRGHSTNCEPRHMLCLNGVLACQASRWRDCAFASDIHGGDEARGREVGEKHRW